MKTSLLLIGLLLALIIRTCAHEERNYNSSDIDVTLKAIKCQDTINNSWGFVSMSTKDGRFWDKVFPDVTGIPDTLTNVNVYFMWLDNEQALFQAYKAGKVDKENFMNYYRWWGMDTTSCIPDYVKTFIVVATAYDSKGIKYYALDTDNDYNLNDETYFKHDSFLQPSITHKVLYENHIDDIIFTDSTWIAFKESGKQKRGFVQFCEYTKTSFLFDTIRYIVKTYPSEGILNKYGDATFFNIIHNETEENLKLNQYLKLSNEYYKITASKDGRTIQLKQTPNALEFGSTQIGMPPLSFTAQTLKGDSINFPKDLRGKFILLDFWSTSCSPCVREINDYYVDIYNEYSDIFEIVGVADDKKSRLDKFVSTNKIDWIIIPDGETKKIQEAYNIYQFPTLFLISPDGKIISSGYDLRGGKFREILEKEINKKAT